MKQIPMCWKCREAITELNLAYDCRELTGCQMCDKIKSYNDAKQYCPLITETKNETR